MEDFLSPLSTIQRAEVPAGLFERIQNRIEQEGSNDVPLKTVFSIAASLLFWFSINAFVMVEQTYRAPEKSEINSIQIISDNNLY